MSPKDAGLFSLFFLSVSIGLAVSSFDSGKIFYEQSLIFERTDLSIAWEKYICRLIILSIVGSGFVFAYVFCLSKEILLSLLCGLYLISEKVFDENQRLLLVQESFEKWGSLQINKSLIQILSIIPAAFISIIPLWFYFIPLIFSNLVCEKNSYFLKTILNNIKKVKLIDLCNQIKYISLNVNIWTVNLSTSILSISDKVILTFGTISNTPGILFVSSGFALYNTSLSMFFFTPKRGKIIRQKIKRSHFICKEFAFLNFISYFCALFAALVLSFLLPLIYRPLFQEIFMLSIIVCVSGLNGIFRECAFYGPSIKKLQKSELKYLFYLIGTTAFCLYLKINLTAIFLIIALLQLLRCFSLWNLCGLTKKP